ncbi:glycoside hydrolase [Tamlana nanhaiensis]|uniref:Glycoside hydrolase n=1 Tax=Neotamlana nanhaiensis TaxID=1382798 RepID=A0A0D7W6D6_9FLAO|nr:sugar-binding domain-containing protein [Tamlana nanhaiensis]KJD34690.1 glycoside hydrolase [Tamlana nanhaiensis]
MQSLKKLVLAAFISVNALSFGQISFGKPEKINTNWKFTLRDDVSFKNPEVDDQKWQTVNLPHDWSVKGDLSPTLASATGYLPGGIGWYRKQLDVPETKQGEKVFLYFEGVYNRSEVYINGQLLGARPNGYISFAFDATEHVKFGETNIISVKVDHSQSADSRWYTGSGIYRNVWLVYANPIHIEQWGVYAYPEVKNNRGSLHVEVAVKNETALNAKISVVNELMDANGKTVAKSSNAIQVNSASNGSINTVLKVKKPKLWQVENPNLYTLKTSVYKGSILIDETVTTTGFRTFTFNPNKGFALNGEWMKIKGVCLHHDAGVLGSAVPKEVWKSRLQTLKEIGVNAIRTSHNPQAPDLYDLCDEIGLLVLNEAYDEWEFPKRKWLEGWNVGTPGFEGSYDIFKDWSETDIEDFVRRDRNHVSVFAWSIGNEVDYPNDPYSHPVLGGADTGFSQAIYGGYKKDAPDAMRLGDIAKRLVAAVKKYDKSRPTTAGLAGVAMSNETEYPGALDITGYNYTESKYQTDHEKYPNRVIFGSENRHDIEAWQAVTENEHIFGQFLWTGIDYLGESGRWPSRGFYSGLVDFSGQIKPRGYFRQSLWASKPMVFLGTYEVRNWNRNNLSKDAWPLWNYEPNKTIRVVCYTNAAYAKLQLNGNEVGKLKPYDAKTGIIHWDIPFSEGDLEAVAYDENKKEVARYSIKSSKRPFKISASVDDELINKNRGVKQIHVEILDEDGVPVKISDNEITCRVRGAGKLLGLEAGNNSDMTDYTDNHQRVFKGKISAYIEASGNENDTIDIEFSSPWLESATIQLKLK